MGSYVGVVRICRTCAHPQKTTDFRANTIRGVVRRTCKSCERARWRRWKRVVQGLPIHPGDRLPHLTAADFERIEVYEARERTGGAA